jgi:hypothetical protein
MTRPRTTTLLSVSTAGVMLMSACDGSTGEVITDSKG